MLSVLDRYLLKEIIANWLAVMLVLWAIVVTNRLVRYLGEAAAGELAGGMILTLVGLKSVAYLATLVPLSLYLGVVLALGRLYRDSEMAALAACGVGYRQLYRPLLGLAGLIAGIALVLTLQVVPRTAALGYQIEAEAQYRATIEAVSAGRFQEARGGRIVIYAREVAPDASHLRQVFVRNLQTDPPMLVTAKRARPERDPDTGVRYLVLEGGQRYQGFPGDPVFRILEFERHGIRMDDSARPEARLKLDAAPTRALLAGGSPRDLAELQWRLALPLAVVVLMVLAVPLSRTRPRQGRYTRLFLAILLFILYYNLLGTARMWLEKGQLPGLIGLWWVHLLPLAAAGWLARQGRLRARRRTPA